MNHDSSHDEGLSERQASWTLLLRRSLSETLLLMRQCLKPIGQAALGERILRPEHLRSPKHYVCRFARELRSWSDKMIYQVC